MRQLNLDQVKALITVIECGSFTAAAHVLNLTQPAVSLQIQELENRFQIKLVERIGRRIRVTPAGDELARIGRRLLDEAEQAHRVMHRFGEGYLGQVRIGMSMTVLIYLMPAVIREIKAKAPSLELVIRTGISEIMLQAVRDNELDLAICSGPLTDKVLDCATIAADPFVAIFPRDQSDVPPRIAPAMVPRWPLVLGNPRSAMRKLVGEWISIAGPVPRPVIELDNVAGIKSVVGAGLGMSVITEIAVTETDSQLQVRPLDPPLTRALVLVQRKEKAEEAAVALVRDALLARIPASMQAARVTEGSRA